MTQSHSVLDTNSIDLLRKNNIVVTAQRLAVLHAVSDKPHSAAEAVLKHVAEQTGTISKQAVYDILALFTEKGLIRRIQPAGSSALYERRVNDNHHHLICRACSKTVDVDCAVGASPCLTSSNDHGFRIDEAEVIYWGICPDCYSA